VIAGAGVRLHRLIGSPRPTPSRGSRGHTSDHNLRKERFTAIAPSGQISWQQKQRMQRL
jgi:hypothetical protein